MELLTLYLMILESKELILFSFLMTLLIIEVISALNKKELYESYKTNMSLFVINGIIASLILLFYPKINHSPSSMSIFIIYMILIDLLLYSWHRLCHTIDYLWNFHKIHHSDNIVNSTTSFRLHFVELIITNVLKYTTGFMLGVDQLMMSFNELVTTLFIVFHHSNIKIIGESYLNKIIITPTLHLIHHSIVRKEHDTNYGTILSLWDRLFNTYLHIDNPKKPGIAEIVPTKIKDLILFGFNKWKPVLNTPKIVYNVTIEEMIAKAAYYNALHRGFEPGNDQYDWYKAEQQIKQMIQT